MDDPYVKYVKCKTLKFFLKCEGSCGYCPIPPSPPPPSPPSPLPSPPPPSPPPMPPPMPPPPLPPLPSPPPPPKPLCNTSIDFVLVLDESYSINRWKDDLGRANDSSLYSELSSTDRVVREQAIGINQPNYMDGDNGVKALAKKLVRHAAMKPR